MLKGAGDENEKFRLAGRASGEYRIVALAPGMQEKLSETGVLQRLLVSAKTVALGAGALHTVPFAKDLSSSGSKFPCLTYSHTPASRKSRCTCTTSWASYLMNTMMRKLLTFCTAVTLCLAAELKPGDPAPPLVFSLVLQAPAGTPVTWKELRGNAVILEFWATWCGGCREQIPHLNRLEEQFRNQPVRFISITDEEPGLVKRFLKDYPISGWVALDSSEKTFKHYGVIARPTTVLVDAAGVVRGIGNASDLTAGIVDNLLHGRPLVFSRETTSSKLQALPEALYQVMVRPAGPVEVTRFGPGAVSGTPGRKWETWGVSLRRILCEAYSVQEDRVQVPAWADEARFDVAISAPRLTEVRRLELLRRCLEDGFQVSVHNESRLTDVYILERRKGVQPKLRPASSQQSIGWAINGRFKAVSRSMAAVARAAEQVLGKPVFDETGLQGKFDFELEWDAANSQSIIEAMSTQLGLDLAPKRRPLSYLVVDSAVQPTTW